MRDLRELKEIPENWQDQFGFWRKAAFVWKRWDRPHEGWTRDHCWLCLLAYAITGSVFLSGSRLMKSAGVIGTLTTANGRRAFTCGSVELASSVREQNLDGRSHPKKMTLDDFVLRALSLLPQWAEQSGSSKHASRQPPARDARY